MRPLRSLALCLALLVAGPVVAAPPPPVTIEADHAVFEEQSGRSTYTGHVRVTRDGLEILADTVSVVTGEDGALQRVLAEGTPVKFRQQREGEAPIEGEARRLDYDAINERLLLLDAAWLAQGGNRVSGQRIDYDTRSERVTAAKGTDGKQRVRVTIQPRDKETP